jgi:hypothetical protein
MWKWSCPILRCTQNVAWKDWERPQSWQLVSRVKFQPWISWTHCRSANCLIMMFGEEDPKWKNLNNEIMRWVKNLIQETLNVNFSLRYVNECNSYLQCFCAACYFCIQLFLKSSVFWDMMCSPLKVNQCFGGTCLHLKGWRISQARNQHEAGSK